MCGWKQGRQAISVFPGPKTLNEMNLAKVSVPWVFNYLISLAFEFCESQLPSVSIEVSHNYFEALMST